MDREIVSKKDALYVGYLIFIVVALWCVFQISKGALSTAISTAFASGQFVTGNYADFVIKNPGKYRLKIDTSEKDSCEISVNGSVSTFSNNLKIANGHGTLELSLPVKDTYVLTFSSDKMISHVPEIQAEIVRLSDATPVVVNMYQSPKFIIHDSHAALQDPSRVPEWHPHKQSGQ